MPQKSAWRLAEQAPQLKVEKKVGSVDKGLGEKRIMATAVGSELEKGEEHPGTQGRIWVKGIPIPVGLESQRAQISWVLDSARLKAWICKGLGWDRARRHWGCYWWDGRENSMQTYSMETRIWRAPGLHDGEVSRHLGFRPREAAFMERTLRNEGTGRHHLPALPLTINTGSSARQCSANIHCLSCLHKHPSPHSVLQGHHHPVQ